MSVSGAGPMLDVKVMVRQCLWIAVAVSTTTLYNMSFFMLWVLTMNRRAVTVTATFVSSGRISLTVKLHFFLS